MSKHSKHKQQSNKHADTRGSDDTSPSRSRSAQLGIGCAVVLILGLVFAAIMQARGGDSKEAAPVGVSP